MDQSKSVHIDNWKDLMDIVGVLRPANVTDSVPSVELSIDSKMTVKPSVKIYNSDPYEAMRIAEDIFNQLRERYN